MSTITSEIKLRIKTEGDAALTGLGAKLNNLANQATASSQTFKGLAAELRNVQSTTVQSTNNLKAYSASWRELAGSVDIASKEFREATAEAAKLDAQIAKAEGRKGRGGRLAGAAQNVGAIAASGVFGGPEGALGAGIGAIAGGPVGAAVGGAIGAQVGGIRQALGATGKYVAELSKLRVALAGVSKNQADYEKNLSNVNKLSNQFLLPLKDTTQQYTKLQASVSGAGLSTKETETVFKGISAAIVATGGTTEDLNSALRATSQVFSKGKVSAEELRQQIGERLPGAFTIFAASLKKTPQELDKALEDGKVTLADFIKFSEELFKRYGKTASIIADAPQNAGARLTLALDKLNIEIGRFIQPIGAQFQSLAIGIVNALTPAIQAFAELMDAPKLLAKERLPQIERQLKEANSQLIQAQKIPVIPAFLPGTQAAVAAQVTIAKGTIKALKGERLSIQETLKQTGAGTGTPPPGAEAGEDTKKEISDRQRAQTLERINAITKDARLDELKNLQRITYFENKITELQGTQTENNKKQTTESIRELQVKIFEIKEMSERINLQKNYLIAIEQAKNEGTERLRIAKRAEAVNNYAFAREKQKLESSVKINQILSGRTKEQTSETELTAKQLTDSQRLFAVLEDQLAIARATTLEEKIRLETKARINQIEYDGKQLAATRTDEAVKQVDAENVRYKILLEQLNLETQLAALKPKSPLQEFVKQATTELQNLEGVAVTVSQGIGDAVGNSVSAGIQGLVEGTANAQQIFSDFLKSIGQILIQEGAKMIATYTAIAIAKSLAGLFGGGGGGFNAGTSTAFGGGIPGLDMGQFGGIKMFAAGGTPPVGRPSLVGEKGPELFVPSSSGTIIPADATAAAMARYQRQGSGSGAGGSGSDVMAAGEATPVLSMSFETTRFLGQDYVSTEQLQAAMMATEKRAAAAGAKAGAAQITSKLQQSPSYRRQVGLR
jgi:tape measure domain-containing protein